MANHFHVDSQKAQTAALLHDVSAIYPVEDRISVAQDMNISLYQEELKFPLIIHQRISAVMAKSIFNINDDEICSAIGCHTTLKRNYSKLDILLFVADKISWDQSGEPPYLNDLIKNLNISLEQAAYFYINYLLNHDIKAVHPWLIEAYQQLKYDVNTIEKL